jgi:hypothetical protein
MITTSHPEPFRFDAVSQPYPGSNYDALFRFVAASCEFLLSKLPLLPHNYCAVANFISIYFRRLPLLNTEYNVFYTFCMRIIRA